MGQFVSQLCDRSMTLGLLWIFTEQQKTDLIPWFLGASALPHVLTLGVVGRWIQRQGALRVLVQMDNLRGLFFCLIAALWFWVPGSSAFHLLFLLSFLSNIAASFFNPAIFMIPASIQNPASMKPEDFVAKLNAFLQLMFSVANVAGPLLTLSLGALISKEFFLPSLFLLNGVSYAVAAYYEKKVVLLKAESALEATSLPSQVDSKAQKSLWHVATQDSLLALMLFGFLCSNLFLSPLMVFLPRFASEKFSGHLGVYSSIEGALALGTVIGGLWLTLKTLGHPLTAPRMFMRALESGLMGVASFYLFFVLTKNLVISEVSLLILGTSLSVANVQIITLFQYKLESSDLPQFMSLVNLIGMAALPVSMIVLGMTQSRFSLTETSLFCAGALLLVTLVLVINLEKSIKRRGAFSSKDSHTVPDKA